MRREEEDVQEDDDWSGRGRETHRRRGRKNYTVCEKIIGRMRDGKTINGRKGEQR